MTALGWVSIIFGVLFALWLVFIWPWPRKKAAPVEQTTKQKPDTVLARLVWSAHVAAQEHDLAVLTGEPEEMEAALIVVIRTNNELETYLWSRRKDKERSDANEPTE